MVTVRRHSNGKIRFCLIKILVSPGNLKVFLEHTAGHCSAGKTEKRWEGYGTSQYQTVVSLSGLSVGGCIQGPCIDCRGIPGHRQ